MSPSEIDELVQQIDTVDFREFSWGCPLLERASTVKDYGVVHAFAVRHHRLTNKKAFSAHAIRQAIQRIDAPDFPFLWRMIDAETNASRIEDSLEDMEYPPWAAAFILGEIGGVRAFQQVTHRLVAQHSARFFILVRLMSHLIVRYLSIPKEGEPTSTVIDVKTGEQSTVITGSVNPGAREMELRKRHEANQNFTPITMPLVDEARTRLQNVPASVFNYPKADFLNALGHLPTLQATPAAVKESASLARTHHYLFSYRALLREFFKHPVETIELLRAYGAQYLEKMWTAIAENSTPGDVLSPNGLACQLKELPGDITLIVVTFPKPERITEAYFAALVFRAGRRFLIPRQEIKRYFTLEHSLASSGEPPTMICEWSLTENALITRANHGNGFAPTVDGFTDSLSKILRDNRPHVWQTVPAGVWG
jgi:hypothetical protein